jgi:prophage antirepressor-like protein
MNDMIQKQFEDNEIRITMDDQGRPWFVAQDVMRVLDIKYTASAIRKLDDDQVSSTKSSSGGQIREFTTVSESGLYLLVFRSDKKEAHKFRRWLSDEVIPSIRKTGSYSTRQKTQGEILLEHAQAFVENEKRIAKINEEMIVVDKKVDALSTTVGQMLMHRKGSDPVPHGTLPIVRIRQLYFRGVSTSIISEFLTAKNHPKVPFTFVTEGTADFQSFAWQELGLRELYQDLVATSSFVKSTPQKWMFSNPMIGNNFGFKKDRLAPDDTKMIESKAMRDVATLLKNGHPMD